MYIHRNAGTLERDWSSERERDRAYETRDKAPETGHYRQTEGRKSKEERERE